MFDRAVAFGEEAPAFSFLPLFVRQGGVHSVIGVLLGFAQRGTNKCSAKRLRVFVRLKKKRMAECILRDSNSLPVRSIRHASTVELKFPLCK